MNTLAEQVAHYKSVKSRLWGTAPNRRIHIPDIPRPQKIAKVIMRLPPKPSCPLLPMTVGGPYMNGHPIIELESGRVTVHRIMRATARRWGMPAEEMIGASRQVRHVVPRQIGMAMSRHLTKAPLNLVASTFGGRDHTTVLHAVQKYKGMIEKLSAHENATPETWINLAFQEMAKRRNPQDGR